MVNAHGHTFDRDAIMRWYARGSRKNPLNNLNLPTLNLSPNLPLKRRIDDYLKKKEEE